MQLKFDAIQAIADLFDGQPRVETELCVALGAAGFAVISNRLDMAKEKPAGKPAINPTSQWNLTQAQSLRETLCRGGAGFVNPAGARY